MLGASWEPQQLQHQTKALERMEVGSTGTDCAEFTPTPKPAPTTFPSLPLSGPFSDTENFPHVSADP